MKKKDLLTSLSEYLKNDNTDETMVNDLASNLCFYFARISLISLIVYLVFTIFTVVNFDFFDELSNVSVDGYLVLTIILVILSLVVFGGFLSLYIYNKRQKMTFTPKYLKVFDIFYQVYDIMNFIGIFLTIFLWIIIFLVTPVEISGESMSSTLSEGDKVIVWRANYEPKLYDIVVIDANDHYTFASDTDFVIKRIMANSGDEVSLSLDGVYSVNGVAVRENIKVAEFKMMLTDASTQKEYYSYDEESRKYYGTVPEGFCIALGDNLNNSMDSKSVGLFHNEDILGKAFFRIYPFGVIGNLVSDIKQVER